jgi:hypothetical protein
VLKQQQRYQNDCSLASIASVLNRHYDDLWPKQWQEYIGENGCYGTDVDKTYEIAGLRENVHYDKLYNYIGWGVHLDWNAVPIYKRVLNGLLYGRRALLQVPSLNFEGKSHLIAWDGRELWDPSKLKVYTDIKDVQWEWVWLINENVERYPSDQREWISVDVDGRFDEDPDSI